MKSIFLINPISGRGHLDAYARLYSRALVELGYRVVLLAAADGGTSGYLARNTPALAGSFSFVSFQDTFFQTSVPARAKLTLLQRAWMVWQEEGFPGVMNRCVSVPYRALRSIIPDSFRIQAGRIERAIGRRLLRTSLARGLNLSRHFDSGRLQFHPLVRCAEQAAGSPEPSGPDLIFFLYLDLMAEQKRNTAVLDKPKMRPWVGILFHPRLSSDPKAPVEGYFASKNSRGGVFLVPSAVPAYSCANPHQHFMLAPDIADLEVPINLPPLAREMRQRAGGRTLVLQIGSITAHKGIPTLLDVIAAADPARFFFALVGEVHWETFGEHKPRIVSFYAQPRENVYLAQGYIDSEQEYNAFVVASDIIYAVYEDFGSSSNSLTKAAGLRRPIMVSQASLMGDRVHRFNIGSVSPEGDANSILQQLAKLAERPKDSFHFEAFEHEHSLETLKTGLAGALSKWMDHPNQTSTNVVAE